MGDYISFILPISQYNNNQQIYEFDLIYSEDLGEKIYTDRRVHCCFNIYKRPIYGLNNKINYKLNDIKITEVRLGNKICNEYDYAICSWGSIGKEISIPNSKQFAKEFYIKINNFELKDKIINLLSNADWCKLYPMTNTPNLLQWQVYKYIKDQIPEIQ